METKAKRDGRTGDRERIAGGSCGTRFAKEYSLRQKYSSRGRLQPPSERASTFMRHVSAVLFDFDHTLGIDHHLELETLRALARERCGANPSETQAMTALMRFRSGRVPLDTMITDALTAWGCSADDLSNVGSEFRANALRDAPQRVTALPGAQDMLRALATRKMPLGILSNGWTELQRLKAALIRFPGPVIVSEEIGAWKPDPRAFEIAASRFDMTPATTLYVGDEPAVDVAGAKAAGMLAAWADLEGKHYPDDTTRPDVIVTDLARLPGLIGR